MTVSRGHLRCCQLNLWALLQASHMPESLKSAFERTLKELAEDKVLARAAAQDLWLPPPPDPLPIHASRYITHDPPVAQECHAELAAQRGQLWVMLPGFPIALLCVFAYAVRPCHSEALLLAAQALSLALYLGMRIASVIALMTMLFCDLLCSEASSAYVYTIRSVPWGFWCRMLPQEFHQHHSNKLDKGNNAHKECCETAVIVVGMQGLPGHMLTPLDNLSNVIELILAIQQAAISPEAYSPWRQLHTWLPVDPKRTERASLCLRPWVVGQEDMNSGLTGACRST